MKLKVQYSTGGKGLLCLIASYAPGSYNYTTCTKNGHRVE